MCEGGVMRHMVLHDIFCCTCFAVSMATVLQFDGPLAIISPKAYWEAYVPHLLFSSLTGPPSVRGSLRSPQRLPLSER
jgi:hypothetical protein